MAAFGVAVEKSKEIEIFVKGMNYRLKESNLITNPFKGAALNLGDAIVIYISPIYLNFPFYGFIFCTTIYLAFQGFVLTKFLIPSLVFLCLSFFWHSYFYYLMIILGLRKAKYKGKIKYINKSEVIRRLLWLRGMY